MGCWGKYQEEIRQQMESENSFSQADQPRFEHIAKNRIFTLSLQKMGALCYVLALVKKAICFKNKQTTVGSVQGMHFFCTPIDFSPPRVPFFLVFVP